MSTEITTIYDALVTKMGTLFSSHKRLSNPYAIDQNNDQILEQGWGLAVRAGNNSNRQLSNRLSVVREFEIVLTRKYFAREQDAVRKATAEKTLLEDLQTLVDDMERNTSLDTGKYLVKYVSDSGVVQIKDGQDQFLGVVVNITVEYFRQL